MLSGFFLEGAEFKAVITKSNIAILILYDFPGSSAGKESACDAGNLGLICGLERSPGEGKGYPHQFSGLENSMDCIVPGVTESDMTDFHLFYILYIFVYTLSYFLKCSFRDSKKNILDIILCRIFFKRYSHKNK